MISPTPRKSALLLFSIGALLGTSAMTGIGQPTPPAQPINLSTRMFVQPGDNVGIGGVILSGSGHKHVIIRAIGPSLTQTGVTGALADPTLELRNSYGELQYANDNWKENVAHRPFIEAAGLQPKNDLESAIDWTFFAPDFFTVIVKGKGNRTGVALVEVYDLSPDSDLRIANISTRAFVHTGHNIVIAGFVLGANEGKERVAVRGLGPSMQNQFGLNTLADPNLELRNANGVVLIANNDWQQSETQSAELTKAELAPTHEKESAIVVTLAPGSYTALLSGRENGVGIGLVEVYDLGTPPPPSTVTHTVTRVQSGTTRAIEKQRVSFDRTELGGTFKISVYQPSVINDSNIGSRAALQGETAPIPFTASAKDIEAALTAITDYYAYGQFGDLEFDSGSFSYFASVGATNREPVVELDVEGGIAASGFTIEFGSLVGNPPQYNTWVAGMPLITVETPESARQ